MAVLIWSLGPAATAPKLGHPRLEQFSAYLGAGAAFVIAYPAHWRSIVLAAVLLIVGLELIQIPAPHHTGRLSDAVYKLAGAAAGVLFTRVLVFIAAPAETAST